MAAGTAGTAEMNEESGVLAGERRRATAGGSLRSALTGAAVAPESTRAVAAPSSRASTLRAGLSVSRPASLRNARTTIALLTALPMWTGLVLGCLVSPLEQLNVYRDVPPVPARAPDCTVVFVAENADVAPECRMIGDAYVDDGTETLDRTTEGPREVAEATLRRLACQAGASHARLRLIRQFHRIRAELYACTPSDPKTPSSLGGKDGK